jgi:hypothetical protein
MCARNRARFNMRSRSSGGSVLARRAQTAASRHCCRASKSNSALHELPVRLAPTAHVNSLSLGGPWSPGLRGTAATAFPASLAGVNGPYRCRTSSRRLSGRWPNLPREGGEQLRLRWLPSFFVEKYNLIRPRQAATQKPQPNEIASSDVRIGRKNAGRVGRRHWRDNCLSVAGWPAGERSPRDGDAGP